jgi:DNA mismatch repair ATPase MutS
VNQLLAQTGLFVYAEQAEISPCDCIYFHFPQEEKAGINTSRFTEECKEFARTTEKVTKYSLVLMNESLSSTNIYDSLVIGEELLRIFADVGCRLVFATHILELAELPEKLNSPTLMSNLASLTAQCDEKGVPTYRITPGKPDRSRNARYIFEKYGISYNEYCRNKETFAE